MTESLQPQRLCRLDDLADPGSRSFSLQMLSDRIEDIFLVRRGTDVFAYRNHCPHTGSPLDWQPHQFLNLDRSLIQCATHSALFRINDGYCVKGPCVGQALTSLEVNLVEGWVEVHACGLV